MRSLISKTPLKQVFVAKVKVIFTLRVPTANSFTKPDCNVICVMQGQAFWKGNRKMRVGLFILKIYLIFPYRDSSKESLHVGCLLF